MVETKSVKIDNSTLEQLAQKVEDLTKAVYALDGLVNDLNKNSDIQFDILSNDLNNRFSELSEKLDSFSSLIDNDGDDKDNDTKTETAGRKYIIVS